MGPKFKVGDRVQFEIKADDPPEIKSELKKETLESLAIAWGGADSEDHDDEEDEKVMA